MAEALKKRSEMDPQFQWDLRDLIPTEKALEELFSELESGIGRYEGFKGRLGEDAAVLKEYLDHDVAMDPGFWLTPSRKETRIRPRALPRPFYPGRSFFYPGPWRHPPLQSRSSLGYRNRS